MLLCILVHVENEQVEEDEGREEEQEEGLEMSMTMEEEIGSWEELEDNTTSAGVESWEDLENVAEDQVGGQGAWLGCSLRNCNYQGC